MNSVWNGTGNGNSLYGNGRIPVCRCRSRRLIGFGRTTSPLRDKEILDPPLVSELINQSLLTSVARMLYTCIIIVSYVLTVVGWMVDTESRPSFAELTAEFSKMSKDPGRYLVIEVSKYAQGLARTVSCYTTQALGLTDKHTRTRA